MVVVCVVTVAVVVVVMVVMTVVVVMVVVLVPMLSFGMVVSAYVWRSFMVELFFRTHQGCG